MTKAEVANLLLERMQNKGMARNEAYQAVEMFLDAVREALLRGEKVSLVGFGTFLIKTRDARNGRNPRTGEQIQIPEKNVVVFKPGKSFRTAVDQNAPAGSA